MKSSLLSKLEMLAAAEEAKRAEVLRRAQAALAQAQGQQEVLHAYRARLAASVQTGQTVSAAQIRSAGLFAEAGLSALEQVGQSAARAQTSIATARAQLLEAQAQHRKLQTATDAARRQEAQHAETRAERALTLARRKER